MQNYIVEVTKNIESNFPNLLDGVATGLLTTAHSSSSYGQPVVIVKGEVMNYSDIKKITLLQAGDKVDKYLDQTIACGDEGSGRPDHGVTLDEWQDVADRLAGLVPDVKRVVPCQAAEADWVSIEY